MAGLKALEDEEYERQSAPPRDERDHTALCACRSRVNRAEMFIEAEDARAEVTS